MSPKIQTLLALLVVALAAGGLVWHLIASRRNPGCGGGCGAVSPAAKAFRKKLPRASVKSGDGADRETPAKLL
jgi:hypothetical protein